MQLSQVVEIRVKLLQNVSRAGLWTVRGNISIRLLWNKPFKLSQRDEMKIRAAFVIMKLRIFFNGQSKQEFMIYLLQKCLPFKQAFLIYIIAK